MVLNFNFTDGAASTKSLPAYFERIVATHATHLAVGGSVWQPTYNELNVVANRIAYALIDHGGTPGDRVAILMRQDAPMIAAIMGILKTGQVLVVMNPVDPPARLKQLVEDAGAQTILTDAVNRQAALDIGAGYQVICFDDHAAEGRSDNPAFDISPHSPAFIVYTSGSTGEPNGVVHPHTAAIATAVTTVRMLEIVPTDRILMLASAGGGQGIGTVLMAVLTGASLWPFLAMEKGVSGLADMLTDRAITVCTWSASIFRHLVMTVDADRRFPAVHAIRMTSEKATTEDFRAFQRHFSDACTLNYSLASSEAGQIARLTLRRGDDMPDGVVLPIGRPHHGVEVALLDDDGHEVGTGETGEIVVTSWSVALGYWGNPTLTAQRYSTRPDAGGRRSLRTGDLARWNSDGLLEFVDRKNRRLKIRGHSVDPLEIEKKLRGVAEVKGATVCVFERAGVEPQLVGFVIPRLDATSQAPLTAAMLRANLRTLLPRYLVPAAFLFVDEFPLTANGKIDRAALLKAFDAARERHELEQPATETEARLAQIWADVLELPAVGRSDDFFELGGDSLNASVVAAVLNAETGVEINLATFFEYTKLSDLASVIERLRAGRQTVTPPIVPVQRDKPLPLSFAQERMWSYSQQPDGLIGYNVVKVHRITGPLDVELLRDCMSAMVLHHEILRTTFNPVGGGTMQVIHPPEPASLPLAELPRDVAPDAAAARIAQAESGQTFDLTRLPLIRFALYRVDAKEHWLVQAFHHVIFDALSAQYYFDELARRYEAAAGRIETPPRQSELQHGDYAVWHRHMYRADGPLFAQSLSWWRNNLASSRALKLPFVRKSARADASPADGWIRFVILPETTRRLNALARAQSATPYTVRLAAFLALLGDETGQSDLSIGTYVSNRHRVVLQNMLGLIINLVTLRVRYDARRPFGEWLAMVGKRVGDVEAHGEIPQRLLDEAIARMGSALPPVEAIFSVSTNRRRFQIADIEVTENCRIAPPTMPWGFSLSLDEAVGGPGCRATFDARRYDPSAVRLFVERFSRLLDAVAQNPELIVSELLARSDTDPRRRSPDQVAELIARMRKLETENERLRTILEREIVPRRHSLSEKFRPKIGSFHHYYPRDLKFPPSYQPESPPQPAPSFAIVTPSYNHAPFVAATIDSVLAQNYPALRYHVQDAGSSDGTTDILKSFGHRISWHSAPDRGQAHGINVGFGAISGDIMAYLNSDDLLSPGALAYVAGAFAAHPNVDFVYSHRICIDENGREIGRWVLPRHDRTTIKWFDFIPQETLFWRRRAWDALGGFDEKYHYALDWDFILRAHAKGMRFLRLPRFLGCFRVHEMQKTSDNFSVGQAETGSLRRIHLGFEPNDRTVSRATAGYLRRHVLFHRLHKLRILKY